MSRWCNTASVFLLILCATAVSAQEPPSFEEFRGRFEAGIRQTEEVQISRAIANMKGADIFLFGGAPRDFAIATRDRMFSDRATGLPGRLADTLRSPSSDIDLMLWPKNIGRHSVDLFFDQFNADLERVHPSGDHFEKWQVMLEQYPHEGRGRITIDSLLVYDSEPSSKKAPALHEEGLRDIYEGKLRYVMPDGGQWKQVPFHLADEVKLTVRAMRNMHHFPQMQPTEDTLDNIRTVLDEATRRAPRMRTGIEGGQLNTILTKAIPTQLGLLFAQSSDVRATHELARELGFVSFAQAVGMEELYEQARRITLVSEENRQLRMDDARAEWVRGMFDDVRRANLPQTASESAFQDLDYSRAPVQAKTPPRTRSHGRIREVLKNIQVAGESARRARSARP